MTGRSVAVVLLAAGQGQRLGAMKPKAFVDLVGKSLLEHAVSRCLNVKDLKQLIIAVPESHLEEVLEFEKQLSDEAVDIRVVVGGETRQDSVKEALAVLAGGIEVVLVHDSARALAPSSLFDRVADAVFENNMGVVPALPVFDTIKRVENNLVQETVDRNTLVRAQTPQGFLAKDLVAAHLASTIQHTDDAALIQEFGGAVMTVAGDEQATKITTIEDLEKARGSLMAKAKTGIGTDSHKFSDDEYRELFLGCLVWPGERGLEGHSDGDVMAHAIVDSLLSAAGLGDIGSNFGVDRPEYAGASGEVFLRATLELLQRQGFEVINVSVQLIGDKPKLAPRRAELEAKLSGLVGAPVTCSATTTDGLGFLGNAEGLAAVATSLIRKVGFDS